MAEQNVMDVPAQFAAEEYSGGNDFDGGDFDASDSGGDSAGGHPAPGTGQSKSSRRRRRKRKTKPAGGASENATPGNGGSAEGGEAVVAPVVMQGESLALAAAAQPIRRQSGPSGNGAGPGAQGQPGQAQGQGQGQGGKRWKKKFRDRERRQQRTDGGGTEPRSGDNGAYPGQGGNYSGGSNGSHGSGAHASGSYAGGSHSGGSHASEGGYRRDGGRPDNFGNLVSGFKRKGKPGSSGGGQGQQRRERSFVGPMDHSYREGELHDGPPSTIQVHGSHGRRGGHRHQGDNQPIDRSMPPPIPIPEGAQTHIYFFIEDLFLTAKIQETARKQGIKIGFVKNEKEALAELTSGEDMNRPALIVFDLNNANAKPLTLIPKLKTKLKRSASIIGFLSSIQGDLKAKAVEAGCDTVMPRAAFSQNLPNLLRRYGVEEAEDVNFNC